MKVGGFKTKRVLALCIIGALAFALEYSVVRDFSDYEKRSQAGLVSFQHHPRNLEECFHELDINLNPALKWRIRLGLTDIRSMHFGLGLTLRNEWGLWEGSELSRYFNSVGIFHPDDMSAIILRSYARHLRMMPIRLESQVRYYQRYWAEAEKVLRERDRAKPSASPPTATR